MKVALSFERGQISDCGPSWSGMQHDERLNAWDPLVLHLLLAPIAVFAQPINLN